MRSVSRLISTYLDAMSILAISKSAFSIPTTRGAFVATFAPAELPQLATAIHDGFLGEPGSHDSVKESLAFGYKRVLVLVEINFWLGQRF